MAVLLSTGLAPLFSFQASLQSAGFGAEASTLQALSFATALGNGQGSKALQEVVDTFANDPKIQLRLGKIDGLGPCRLKPISPLDFVLALDARRGTSPSHAHDALLFPRAPSSPEKNEKPKPEFLCGVEAITTSRFTRGIWHASSQAEESLKSARKEIQFEALLFFAIGKTRSYEPGEVGKALLAKVADTGVDPERRMAALECLVEILSDAKNGFYLVRVALPLSQTLKKLFLDPKEDEVIQKMAFVVYQKLWLNGGPFYLGTDECRLELAFLKDFFLSEKHPPEIRINLMNLYWELLYLHDKIRNKQFSSKTALALFFLSIFEDQKRHPHVRLKALSLATVLRHVEAFGSILQSLKRILKSEERFGNDFQTYLYETVHDGTGREIFYSKKLAPRLISLFELFAKRDGTPPSLQAQLRNSIRYLKGDSGPPPEEGEKV